MPLSYSEKTWIKVKSAYLRITQNKVVAAFFLFAFVHCLAQGIIQSFLFSVDNEYSALLSGIVQAAEVPRAVIPNLMGDLGHYTLQVCNDIPHGQPVDPCLTVFKSGQGNFSVTPGFRRSTEGTSALQETIVMRGRLSFGATRDASNQINGVHVRNKDGTENAFLDNQCTRILTYAQQTLNNARREDLTFIAVQFWLFSVSFVAILYDSIPHTLAVLCARTLVTGWSSYAVWRTNHIHETFNELIINPGTPCRVDLSPDYFKLRTSYEIPDLVLNCTALILCSYLSFSMLKLYKAQSFKCVGAPLHIMRIYKFFMALLVCLQLGVFLLVAAMCLWVDELVNTAISVISAHTIVYEGLFITTILLLLPWIYMGWYSIRHENKKLMTAFLIIAFFFIFGWSLMFYSRVYRWTFLQWPYLACLTLESFILLIASMVLGGVCWLNFNKGLAQYLHAEDTLASLDFEPSSFEHQDVEKQTSKLQRSADQPVPTYYIPTLHSHDRSESQYSFDFSDMPAKRGPTP